MTPDQSLEEIKKMLQPVIGYFDKIKLKYNSGSKGDRKLRYASYNLAKIYYYLDDPDDAMAEAGELMINNYDEKDGRGLEAAAADLKQLLKLNKMKTRHFPIDTDQYIGPGFVHSGW